MVPPNVKRMPIVGSISAYSKGSGVNFYGQATLLRVCPNTFMPLRGNDVRETHRPVLGTEVVGFSPLSFTS
jgi:hypothetical protein